MVKGSVDEITKSLFLLVLSLILVLKLAECQILILGDPCSGSGEPRKVERKVAIDKLRRDLHNASLQQIMMERIYPDLIHTTTVPVLRYTRMLIRRTIIHHHIPRELLLNTGVACGR